MCAIAGLIGMYYNEQILQEMLSTMLHRGPDGNGVYTQEECALLHSRLAIIDPVGGAQPMKLTWEAEEYIIVYNGELYNTYEIKKELYSLGHRFLGHSDTEVVLHAFAQWKETALEKLNGIFAFGVWMESAHKLFLARDRMGVKPLFFIERDNGLIFASEIKTILAYPGIEAQLDAEGVAQILLLGPGRIPGSGVFRDVFELKPGCYAWYCNDTFQQVNYWKLKDREHRENFEETAAYVRYLVSDAIQRQMVSDVPIGTFLSGGLDSSVISSICARNLAYTDGKLHTFSLDYKDSDRYFVPGKFQPNSDNAYIEKMENWLKSKHDWTVLTPEALVAELEEATYARDLPGMADVDFSLLAFCREIRKHVKVALSGECADEIFGGYPWYRDPEVRDADGFPWAQNTLYRASFLSGEYGEQISAEEFVREQYNSTLRESDILPGAAPLDRRMKEMVNLNQKWFMQTLLDRKDRMSMYCGLEVRVPFCDYRIAEYLYGVPWEYKDYKGREKGLLRYAMQGTLPDEVLYRKKSPYPKTHDPHYTELVVINLRQLLSEKEAPIFQIVQKGKLEELIGGSYAWPWYGQLMKTPQTIAYMLQINCWLEKYRVRLI